MTEYEKLMLKGLAQILRALGNIQDENGDKRECEQVANQLESNSW